MTAHPIDTEALRQDVDFAQRLTGTYQADSTRGYYPAMERIFEAVPALLDALAAAEHRATRAEAQAAIRGRAVKLYQKRASEAEAERDSARGYISELETAVKSRNDVIKHRDARIKAVQDALSCADMGETLVTRSRIRRALDGGQ